MHKDNTTARPWKLISYETTGNEVWSDVEALEELRRVCPYSDSNTVTTALEKARMALKAAKGE